jgi:quercetin dioxygenase-like cupin family protein
MRGILKSHWFGVGLVVAVAFVGCGRESSTEEEPLGRVSQATGPSGFSGTTVALGRFDDIDVHNNIFPSRIDAGAAWLDAGTNRNVWVSFQRTQGPSDLYLQNNVWQPNGTTGWHTHPGHSLITVTAGTITAYEADCIPHVYTVGMGFVDSGGDDHAHVLRNEGSVEAKTMAVQLVPAGAPRRLDKPNPGCPVN